MTLITSGELGIYKLVQFFHTNICWHRVRVIRNCISSAQKALSLHTNWGREILTRL